MTAVGRRVAAATRVCLKQSGLVLAVVVAALTLQPAAALTSSEAAWYRNEQAATLWSDSGAEAQPYAVIPQFLGFFRLDWPQEPVNGRVFAFYPGDTSGVQPGYVWVDAALLTTMPPPPPGPLARPAVGVSVNGVWLRNHADATLWSGSAADATPFAVIPKFLGLFQVPGSPEARDGRMFVYYPGDSAGVQPGFGWVDLAVVGPADPPTEAGPIVRPPPPLVSEWPRPLEPGSGRVIRRVQTSAPLVALTLDDAIDHGSLDALLARNVKVTLFLTGAWVQARPDTAQRALAEGHELGNHTWGHPWLRAPNSTGLERAPAGA
jgi:hypothetical protein